MAYNLYQAQMAKAWAQRVEREEFLARRFWSNHAVHDVGPDGRRGAWEPTFYSGSGMSCQPYGNLKDIETCSSIAPTYVSDVTTTTGMTETTSTSTQRLKDRLEILERELMAEREKRMKMEETLNALRASGDRHLCGDGGTSRMS